MIRKLNGYYLEAGVSINIDIKSEYLRLWGILDLVLDNKNHMKRIEKHKHLGVIKKGTSDDGIKSRDRYGKKCDMMNELISLGCRLHWKTLGTTFGAEV